MSEGGGGGARARGTLGAATTAHSPGRPRPCSRSGASAIGRWCSLGAARPVVTSIGAGAGLDRRVVSPTDNLFFFLRRGFRASSCVPTDALRNRIVVDRTAAGDRPTPHAPAGPPWAARRTRPWLCFGAPPRVGGRLCWWRGWTQTRRVETAAGQVKVVDRRKGQACQQACAKRLPARAPLIASEAEAKREGRSKGRRRGRHRAAAAARAISLPSPTPARPPSAPTTHTR